MIKQIPTLCFFLLLLLSACSNEGYEKNEIATVQSLMNEQEKAWNNGDLEEFMAAYKNSDSLVFIGSRGLSYGWATTLSNYKKSYGTKSKMGRLLFENEKLERIGNSAIWVAGRWNLFRETDTLNGSYLLVWEKINGEWKIVADHSS